MYMTIAVWSADDNDNTLTMVIITVLIAIIRDTHKFGSSEEQEINKNDARYSILISYKARFFCF